MEIMLLILVYLLCGVLAILIAERWRVEDTNTRMLSIDDIDVVTYCFLWVFILFIVFLQFLIHYNIKLSTGAK